MASKTTPPRFYDIWFPRKTQNIMIVAPPSSDGLEDAELTSPNYAMLDRLGDRDSVYAIGKLLSRRYPNAVIHLASSEDFARQSLAQNFVIIGGPGAPKANHDETSRSLTGNEACRKFLERHRSRFSYSNDCETLVVGGREFRAAFDHIGHMTKDFAVFAAFTNPYLRSTRIVMLHGIHTLGVVGATRVFDGDYDSLQNFEAIESHPTDKFDSLKPGFECFFEVDVMHGEVECPTVEPKRIFPLREGRDSAHSETVDAADSSSILSATDLKAEILGVIAIARQHTLPENRRGLDEIHDKVSNIESPDLQLMQNILDVCRRNPRIPPESVALIRKEASGGNT